MTEGGAIVYTLKFLLKYNSSFLNIYPSIASFNTSAASDNPDLYYFLNPLLLSR